MTNALEVLTGLHFERGKFNSIVYQGVLMDLVKGAELVVETSVKDQRIGCAPTGTYCVTQRIDSLDTTRDPNLLRRDYALEKMES